MEILIRDSYNCAKYVIIVKEINSNSGTQNYVA